MTFAKEALPFVLPLVIAAMSLALFRKPGWALLLGCLALCVLLFFRVPVRRVEVADGTVLAPANGRVLRIDRAPLPADEEAGYQRIVIFLSVFDVHVQRAPVTGEVIESRFTPGRKVAAFKADAGEVNENQLTVLRCDNGDLIGVRQIAGLVARRVVSYLQPGDRVEQGELIGLIKFGSRVDLMLPENYEILVREGHRVREGLTVVARSEGP
jgi:phosphatidylserine decarboxylase